MTGGFEQGARALEGLGFSGLEASIYAFLAGHSPATGYGVAQAIGKPVANTYQGLSVLQAKGAVIAEDGPGRLCRAVPPAELFGRLRRDLQTRCDRAAEALAKVEPAGDDGRVYRLGSRTQVFGRVREMIRGSRQVVLLSAFPGPLEEIKDDLEAAAARGVGVLLKAYRPVSVRGAEVIFSTEAGNLLKRFPGQEVNAVIDAEQMLVALLPRPAEEDRAIQAVWSDSVYLSVLHYNGLYSEWLLTRLAGRLRKGGGPRALREAIKRSYPLMQTPGYLKLVGDVGRGDAARPGRRRQRRRP